MRIVVIGAGAIGGFVGGKLAASGQDVTFVGRPSFVEAVRDKGLRIVEPGHTTAVPAKADARRKSRRLIVLLLSLVLRLMT